MSDDWSGVERALEQTVVLRPSELPCAWIQDFLQPCKNVGIYPSSDLLPSFVGLLCVEHYNWYFQFLNDSWWNTGRARQAARPPVGV